MNPLMNSFRTSQNALGQNKNIGALISMLKGQNPNQVFNSMLQSNPQFRQFVEQNKGKSVDEIAKSYGVDMSLIKQLLK